MMIDTSVNALEMVCLLTKLKPPNSRWPYCTMTMEIVSFKVSELGKLIERDIINSANKLANSFVEVENLPMGTRMN